MHRHPLLLSAIGLALNGCATTVDLQALRNEVCKSAAVDTYISTSNTLTNTLAPLNASPQLTLILSSTSVPPSITPEDIASGTALLNAAIPNIHVNRLSATPLTGAAAKLLPLADHYALEHAADVQPSSVKLANDARTQVREILSEMPVASTKFLSDPNSLIARIGSVDKAHVTSMNKVHRTLKAGGYELLAAASLGQLSKDPTSSQEDYLVQEFNTARFLATYYKAYFRGGHILQVSIDTGALLNKAQQDLQSKVDSALSAANGTAGLTSAQQSAITTAIGSLKTDVGNGLSSVSTNLCKNGDPNATTGVCLLTQPLGDISFITRAGTSIQFAGETISFGTNGKLAPTTSKISSSVVGPQLAQVLWEAVFDSVSPFVPATANSTACVNHLYPDSLCLNTSSPAYLTQKISTVDSDATTAETTTTSVAGYIIRGGWLFSLNNEAVAETVETSAGEIARKITEKLVWVQVSSGSCAAQPVHPSVGTAKEY